jgi:hypothetical protein
MAQALSSEREMERQVTIRTEVVIFMALPDDAVRNVDRPRCPYSRSKIEDDFLASRQGQTRRVDLPQPDSALFTLGLGIGGVRF